MTQKHDLIKFYSVLYIASPPNKNHVMALKARAALVQTLLVPVHLLLIKKAQNSPTSKQSATVRNTNPV